MEFQRRPFSVPEDPKSQKPPAESAHPQTGSFDELQRQWLQDSEYRRLWEATAPKRAIALALVRLRKQAQLTQSDVAQRAGWNKAFVSRLEGAGGSIPDTTTLARYAEACGRSVGLVFLDVEADQAQVIDAVTLAAPAAAAHPFERLRGDAWTLPEIPVAEAKT
ncbi:MAG: helix-turn-helix transcriptional regulator [Proteobacteria bacterium]|nr:helix-turn-helix transcriptional regulator [Pseudomonadota bacterium]